MKYSHNDFEGYCKKEFYRVLQKITDISFDESQNLKRLLENKA